MTDDQLLTIIHCLDWCLTWVDKIGSFPQGMELSEGSEAIVSALDAMAQEWQNRCDRQEEGYYGYCLRCVGELSESEAAYGPLCIQCVHEDA